MVRTAIQATHRYHRTPRHVALVTGFFVLTASLQIGVSQTLTKSNVVAESNQADSLPDRQQDGLHRETTVRGQASDHHYAVLKPRSEDLLMGPTAPLFLPALTYSSGGELPQSVAIADLNGDGNPDLVVSNSCRPGCSASMGVVAVLMGKGDGTFKPAVIYESGGSAATAVAVADFNGDHNLDLVVAHCGLAGGDDCRTGAFVGILLGNGDGTFQPAVTYSSGGFGAIAVAVGDVNRDGKLDLAVSNNSADGFTGEGNVAVLLGNGDGSFQAPVTYDSGGVSANSVVLRDVNGDGKPDVLVSNQCALPDAGCSSRGVLGVLLAKGDGTLSPVVGYDAGGYTSTSIAVEDVNGDSKPDVLVFSNCDAIGNDCAGDVVGVLLGNGDGTFQPSVIYFSGGPGGSNGSVVAVDVNGDHRPDLLATNGASSTVGVLLGNGDGTFQAQTTYDTGGSTPDALAAADLNGDALPDVVVTQCAASGCDNGDLVGVLLHVGAKPTHITIVSSLNPSIFGQAVTFTSRVSSGSGTPTGIVAFFDGATSIGSATLVSASASISVSGLAVGSHSISAVYQGSVKFNSSVSVSVEQVVNVASTTTSLTSSHNPGLVNQSVTYTATITSQYGGAATGTVTFFESGSPIATATVSGNRATYSKRYKSIGVHSITATYSGDANNGGSASGTLTEYIQATTKTVLTTSGTPSHSGQPVTFTATVTSKHGAVPDGELVKFYDSSKLLASVALAGGTAAYTTSTLSVATHTIRAKYVGDTFFRKSTGKVTQIVEP